MLVFRVLCVMHIYRSSTTITVNPTQDLLIRCTVLTIRYNIIICVHVILWKQNCIRPIKSNIINETLTVRTSRAQPLAAYYIGIYLYTTVILLHCVVVGGWRRPFIVTASILIQIDRFFPLHRISVFHSSCRYRGPAKRNTAPPPYHTYIIGT